MLGLCSICVIACCRLGSLEFVATLPIGRVCPRSILFCHLLPSFAQTLDLGSAFVQTPTHTPIAYFIIFIFVIFVCYFFLAALQQGFACMSGKSESCC